MSFDDLFEVDDDSVAVATGESIDEFYSGVAQEVAAGVARKAGDFDPDDDRQVSTWFNVTVLTVPDVDRFPVPACFGDSKQPVDLSKLAELPGGEIRKLIMPSLPDEQLAEIEAAEKSREKPRGMVLNAITAEKHDRGVPCDACGHAHQRFEDWVEKTAANPLSCRIAAIAWQVGDAEVVAMAPVSLEEEAAALADLRVAWSAFARGSGFDRLAAWDLDAVMPVVISRRLVLGAECQHDDFLPCYRITGREWIQRVDGVGGLRVAAQSLGQAEHEIPYLPTAVDVFRVFRKSPGAVELSDWAAAKLTLERDLLQLVQVLW